MSVVKKLCAEESLSKAWISHARCI